MKMRWMHPLALLLVILPCGVDHQDEDDACEPEDITGC